MSFAKFRDNLKPDASDAGTTSTVSSTGSNSAVLSSGTSFVGNISFQGSALVDSIVEGQIFAGDVLTIGEAAKITGTITGVEIIIRGTVQGDISASKKLVLKKPAKILGNISAASISIEEGVHFEGKCSMKQSETNKNSKTEKLEPVAQKS